MDGFAPYTFAAIQLFCSTISSALQLLALPIFIIYDDYRNKIGFHMLFAIGVFDCSQTVTHLIADIYYLAGWPFEGAMERINCAVNLVGWNALVMQHCLLAANRFAVIVPPFFFPSVRDSRAVDKFFKYCQVLLWLWFAFTTILFLTPWMGGSFQEQFVGFSVNETYPYSYVFDEWYAIMGMTIPWGGVGCYVCIFVVLKFSRDRSHNATKKAARTITITNDNQQNNKNSNNNNRRIVQMSKAEKHLLIQAVILFTGLLLFDYYWPTFKLGQQLFIFFTLIYCGLNPVLYMTMSSEFRHRLLKTYGLKRTKQHTGIIVVSNTNATLKL